MSYRVMLKTKSFTAILLSGLSEDLAKQAAAKIIGKTALDPAGAFSSVKSQVVQDAWAEEEPSANPSVI